MKSAHKRFDIFNHVIWTRTKLMEKHMKNVFVSYYGRRKKWDEKKKRMPWKQNESERKSLTI